MLEIKKTKITPDDILRKKITFAGSYANLKVSIQDGNLIKLEPTNIAYVEPHKVEINKTMFLFFNYSDTFFINDLRESHNINRLSEYFKKAKTLDI